MNQNIAHILVLDDDPVSLLAVSKVVSKLENVAAIAVSTGQEAKEELLEREFALAILDVSMPDISGFDMAKWMREQDIARNTPILFLTAMHKDSGSMADAYDLGAVDYMFKPFDIKMLRSKVRVFADLYLSRKALQISEEALAERRQELEISQERFVSLYEHMPSGVVVLGPENDGQDFIVRHMNPAGERLSNVKLEEIRGKRMTETFPGIQAMGLFDVFRRVWRTGVPETLSEAMYVDGEGGSAWFQNSVYKLPFGELIAVYDDITDRKRAEEAIRQSEERLNKTLDVINEGVWDWRLDTGEVFFSPSYYTMLGYEVGEFEPSYENFRALVHPGDLARTEHEVSESLKKGMTYAVEVRLRTKDGGWRWILTRGMAAEFDARGNPVRVLGTHMDITETRKAEEDLRYSRMLLKKTFESLAEAVFIVEDKTFVCMDCNPAATEIFGYGREELIGHKTDKLHVSNEMRKQFRERLTRETREKGYLHLAEYMLRRKSGETFTSEHYVTPMENEQGERLAWVSVVRDVTEQRQAREQLKQRSFELEVMHKLSRKLGYTLDYEDVVQLFIENLSGVLEFDVAACLLVQEDMPKVFAACKASLNPSLREEIGERMREVASSAALSKGLPALEACPRLDCRKTEQGRDHIHELQSSFQVPLFESEAGVAGVLFVGSRQPKAFGAGQISLVTKVAEQASTSMQRLRALVDEHLRELSEMVRALPSGIVLLDSQGTVVMANPKGREKLRLLSGKGPGEMLVELGGMDMNDVLAQALDEYVQLQMEYKGPPRRIFQIAARRLMAGPQAGGCVLSMIDVTREQEDAEKIQASERRFKTIFDNSSDAIFLHGLDGVIQDVNAVACDRLGYSRAELRGMSLMELIPPKLADESRLRALINAVTDKGSAFFETIQQSKGGGEVPTEVIAKLIEYEGWPTILATARDITERKLAEQERIEHEAMLDAIFTGIQAAFFVIDPGTMKIEDTNDQAATLLGMAEKEIIGRACREVLTDPVCTIGPGEDAAGEDWTFLGREAVLTLRGGENIPVAANRLRMAMGGRTLMVIILFDISEQKALERQLSYAQKLESIGQLASGIAHEINTPIQYVAGNIAFLNASFGKVRLLLERYNDLYEAVEGKRDAASLLPGVREAIDSADLDYLLEEIPQAVADSQEGVDRVTHIVQAMKKFSHPDVEDMKQVDVNEAVESTVTVARNEWKYDSEMILDLAPALPAIVCVPGDLNQAVLNVLVNAAHANSAKVEEQGGRAAITVATAHQDQWVEIRIGDTGMGIPEQHQNRIFDPFFTTKEVGKGTGQGLAITHSIMEKHGGTITFETRQGEGTTFSLRFPLRPPEHNIKEGR